jgi:hypothetical protein
LEALKSTNILKKHLPLRLTSIWTNADDAGQRPESPTGFSYNNFDETNNTFKATNVTNTSKAHSKRWIPVVKDASCKLLDEEPRVLKR